MEGWGAGAERRGPGKYWVVMVVVAGGAVGRYFVWYLLSLRCVFPGGRDGHLSVTRPFSGTPLAHLASLCRLSLGMP